MSFLKMQLWSCFCPLRNTTHFQCFKLWSRKGNLFFWDRHLYGNITIPLRIPDMWSTTFYRTFTWWSFFVPSATRLWTATTSKLFCNYSFCDFPVIALIDTCLFQPLLSRDPILVKSQKWLYAMSPPQQQCPLRNAMFKNGFRRHIHIYSLFRSYKMEIKPQYNIKESIFTKKYIINPILATFREFREIVEFDQKIVKSSLNRLGFFVWF